jgi:dienelactone hydrolase
MLGGARSQGRMIGWGGSARVAGTVLVVALALVACGGGGSVSPDPAEPEPDGEVDADGDAEGSDAGASGLTPVVAPESPAFVEPLPVVSGSWDEGTFELSDGTPVRSWGVTAAPEGNGPFPVAVLLHGSHPICRNDANAYGSWPCPGDTEIANHEGLRYLAEAIAARGFVVIAPSVNAQYTFGAGEPMPATRSSEIAERALTALAAGELGIDPAQVDIERIVTIGHSVGGEDAGLFATGETSFTRAVAGVVMLQPALLSVSALPDVPAVVLIGECDGDTGVDGGMLVSDALLQTRQTPAALLTFSHMTHNATNEVLGPDFFPVSSPGCAEDQLMPAEEQRAQFADVVPELARAVLGDGGSGWAGIVFDEPETPDGVVLGLVPGGAAAADVPGGSASIVDELGTSGVTVTYCPFGYYTPFVEPDKGACHRPELPLMVGRPRTLSLVWDEPGASVTVPMAAGAGDVLRLRAFPDVADGRLGDGPVRIQLTTDTGASVEVELAVPPSVFEQLDEFGLWHALLPWQTAVFDVGGDVTSIELTMLEPDAGAIQLLSFGVD